MCVLYTWRIIQVETLCVIKYCKNLGWFWPLLPITHTIMLQKHCSHAGLNELEIAWDKIKVAGWGYTLTVHYYALDLWVRYISCMEYVMHGWNVMYTGDQTVKQEISYENGILRIDQKTVLRIDYWKLEDLSTVAEP